ncbi:RagB/SusD family nutrient uptake outer membrane protein [Chitinophaga lutea]
MKRIFLSLSAIAILLGGAGCHDSLLNMTPGSSLTTSNFYKTSAEINQAVLGVYSTLQSRKQTDYVLMEAPSDNLYMSTVSPITGSFDVDNLVVNPENVVVANFWDATYSGIFRANQVLLNIDNPKDYTGVAKDQYTGEAKFMRALFYFDLVRVYGGVPLVTTQISITEARNQARATADQIYDQIVADLTDAVAKLPAAMVKGRASKGAATALLGKVYIYRKDYPNAMTYLGKAVTDFGYDLVPNFASLWSPATEDNIETIFQMKYIESTNGQTLSTSFIPNGGVYNIVDRGNETALPSWSLNKLFVAGDKRKANTITDLYVAPTRPNDPPQFYPYVSKYATKHPYNNSGLDLPVIRFADVLLLHAEALYNSNDKDGALKALNRVRQRAFGDASHNYAAADIATPDAFLNKLLLERQLELAYENERWFDLVRTGKFTTVMEQEERLYNDATQTPLVTDLSPKAYMAVFPIPQRQIDQYNKDVLKQNPDYTK